MATPGKAPRTPAKDGAAAVERPAMLASKERAVFNKERALELAVAACVAKMAQRETHKQGVADVLEVMEHDVSTENDLTMLLRCLAKELHTSGGYVQQARVELASLYGLLGEMYGSSLGAANVPRMVAVLCERLAVDGDSKVCQAVSDALATLCAECTAANAAPCAAPFESKALLEVFAAPLFKLMREPHRLSQAGAARAIVEVVRRFPDAAQLDAAFAKLATPLVKFFEQRDFGGRLHVLNALVALVERHGGAVDVQTRATVLPQCVRVAVSAMADHRSEHEWPVRASGARLLSALTRVLRAEPDADALRRLAGLRHDKVADVRSAAGKAVDVILPLDSVKPLAHLLAVDKSAPPDDATLARRKPVRQRERNAAFDDSSESSEAVQIFYKEPQPQLRHTVDNDNNSYATSAAVAPVAVVPPSGAPVGGSAAAPSGAGAVTTELRTLMRQQEEILQALNSLRKAVESGMRTLNARVRVVEETLQDLMDAVDERAAE